MLDEQDVANAKLLVELLGYDTEHVKLYNHPPVDDFEQVRRHSWKVLIENVFYGAIIKRHIFDEEGLKNIPIDILRSMAFYLGGKTQPQIEYIKEADRAWARRKAGDSLLTTLIKLKIRNWWHGLFFMRWYDRYRYNRQLRDFS
jgi:hypothetical protein